jgi:hypothetical protein
VYTIRPSGGRTARKSRKTRRSLRLEKENGLLIRRLFNLVELGCRKAQGCPADWDPVSG